MLRASTLIRNTFSKLNHYRILQVAEEASFEQIKQKYL